MKYIVLILLFYICFNIHVKASEIKSIYISEILPDGAGADAGKEWIELFNNLDEPLNIKDYYLINRSLSGTERKITISSSLNLPPKQFFLISEGAQNITSENIYIIGSGKINMYNDESDLELYDSDGALIDKVHYLKPTEAKSLERKGPLDILDCNKLVSNPTGSSILTENTARDPVCFGQLPISAPTEPSKDKCISIGLITSNLVDNTICTRGSVTVEPDILGDKIFYIQDGGLGFKIKLKTTPSIILKLGDRVEISGVLKSIKDGLYLYADSTTLISPKVSVYPAKLDNLDSQKYSLVEYTGEIMKNYSKSIDLELGDSTVRVSVLASTGIDMPTRTVGDKLKITGILIQEGGLYKILPRYQEDIEVLEEELITKSSISSQAQTIEKTDVRVTTSKPMDNVVINKLPLLSVNKINIQKNKLVSYSIGRGWLILLVLILFILFVLILFRKAIWNYFKKLKIIEFKTLDEEIIKTKEIDFEKDKYELMFGTPPSLEGG